MSSNICITPASLGHSPLARSALDSFSAWNACPGVSAVMAARQQGQRAPLTVPARPPNSRNAVWPLPQGPQLYHYFDDKAALVRAVIAQQTDTIVGNQELFHL